MKRTPLLALLGLLSSSTSFAAVINRTCGAIIGGGGARTGGGEIATASPPCSLNFRTSTNGPVGSVLAPQGDFGGTMQTTLTSDWNESGEGFTIDTSLSGSASFNITSGLIIPSGPGYNSVAAGIFEYGRSRETFSVDRPYTFTLDFNKASTVSAITAPGHSASAEGLLSISRNFLSGPYSGEDLIQLNSTGILTGLLIPGETYWLAADFGMDILGGARNGDTETSSLTWGGTLARLKAVAVPTPGTSTLILGALALLFVGRRLRQTQASAGG